MQGFAGVDYSTGAGGSSGPVQFERQQEQDPFGLDKYATDVRAGKKNALDGIGSGGGNLLDPSPSLNVTVCVIEGARLQGCRLCSHNPEVR